VKTVRRVFVILVYGGKGLWKKKRFKWGVKEIIETVMDGTKIVKIGTTGVLVLVMIYAWNMVHRCIQDVLSRSLAAAVIADRTAYDYIKPGLVVDERLVRMMRLNG